MINALNYIFVESLFPITSRVSFVTDLTSEKVYCKSSDFYEALKNPYKFRVDDVKDIKTKIEMGTSLVIDLSNKQVFNFDEMDKIILQKKVIREPGNRGKNSFEDMNRYIENLVNKNYPKN